MQFSNPGSELEVAGRQREGSDNITVLAAKRMLTFAEKPIH